MKMLAKIRSAIFPKPRERTVTYDPVGFAVFIDGEEAARIAWSAVLEVFAFKQDLFAYDQICFAFRCDEGLSHWWVGEHEVDFEAFVREVQAHFPGLRSDWYDLVAQPPFAENWTSIWRRE